MGYPDFRLVSAVAELSPDHKDFYLTFTVEEGERYTFGKVDIVSHLKQVNAEELKLSISPHFPVQGQQAEISLRLSDKIAPERNAGRR